MKPRSYGPFPYSPIIDRPRLEWPNGAHVALWIIPNIEYFSMLEKPGGYGASDKITVVVMWGGRDYGHRGRRFVFLAGVPRSGLNGPVGATSPPRAETAPVLA